MHHSIELMDVHVRFENVPVLQGVHIEAKPYEFVSVIGANGAGKSTLLGSIVGLVPVRNGKVLLDDIDVTNFLPEEMVARGVSLVPEGRQMFTNMSVWENLLLGA